MVFLYVNGIELECTDEEIIDLGLGVAAGKYDAEYMTHWIIGTYNR